MSKTSLYVFIEGYMDRSIYDQIFDPVCERKKILYRLVAISDIDGFAGGKKSLLEFYDYLQENNSLIDTFKSKKTLSMFYADKDIDDFRKIIKKSEHIVYTEFYEIENYLFEYGELISSVATACSLRRREVKNHLKDVKEWKKQAAYMWKDWICLCMFSLIHSIDYSANYSNNRSAVNGDGGYGSTDDVLYKKYLLALRKKSKLDKKKFTTLLKSVIKETENIYKADEYDKVFKGKRYFNWLTRDILKIKTESQYDMKDFAGRVRASLIHTLNFENGWAEHFKAPLRKMLAKAKI